MLGKMEGHSFSRSFERRDFSLFSEVFYTEFERYVKKRAVKGQLSP
jgi:hypothetical protein